MEEEEFELIYKARSPKATEFEFVQAETVRTLDNQGIRIHDDHFVSKKNVVVPSKRSGPEVLQPSPQISEKRPLYSEILKGAQQKTIVNEKAAEEKENVKWDEMIGEDFFMESDSSSEESDSDSDCSEIPYEYLGGLWASRFKDSDSHPMEKSFLSRSLDDYGLKALFESSWEKEEISDKLISMKTSTLVLAVSLSILIGGCLGNWCVSLLMPMDTNMPVENALFTDDFPSRREEVILSQNLNSPSEVINLSLPWQEYGHGDNLRVILREFRRLQTEHRYLKQAYEELKNSNHIERQMKWYWRKVAEKEIITSHSAKYTLHDGLMKMQQSNSLRDNKNKNGADEFINRGIRGILGESEDARVNFQNGRDSSVNLKESKRSRIRILYKGWSTSVYSNNSKLFPKNSRYPFTLTKLSSPASNQDSGKQILSPWEKIKRQRKVSDNHDISFNSRTNKNHGKDMADQRSNLTKIHEDSSFMANQLDSTGKPRSSVQNDLYESYLSIGNSNCGNESAFKPIGYNIECKIMNVDYIVDPAIRRMAKPVCCRSRTYRVVPTEEYANATITSADQPVNTPQHEGGCDKKRDEIIKSEEYKNEIQWLKQKFIELQLLSAASKGRERRHRLVAIGTQQLLKKLRNEKYREFKLSEEKYRLLTEQLMTLKSNTWEEMQALYSEKQKDKHYIAGLERIIKFSAKAAGKWKETMKEQIRSTLRTLAIEKDQRIKREKELEGVKSLLTSSVERELKWMEMSGKIAARNEKIKEKLKKKVYHYKSVYEQSTIERDALRQLFQTSNEEVTRQKTEIDRLSKQLSKCRKNAKENEMLKILQKLYADFEESERRRINAANAEKTFKEETHLSVVYDGNNVQKTSISESNIEELETGFNVNEINEEKSNLIPGITPYSHGDAFEIETLNQPVMPKEMEDIIPFQTYFNLNSFLSNFVGADPKSQYPSAVIPPKSLHLSNPFVSTYDTKGSEGYLMEQLNSLKASSDENRINTPESMTQTSDTPYGTLSDQSSNITLIGPCVENFRKSILSKDTSEGATMQPRRVATSLTVIGPSTENFENSILSKNVFKSEKNLVQESTKVRKNPPMIGPSTENMKNSILNERPIKSTNNAISKPVKITTKSVMIGPSIETVSKSVLNKKIMEGAANGAPQTEDIPAKKAMIGPSLEDTRRSVLNKRENKPVNSVPKSILEKTYKSKKQYDEKIVYGPCLPVKNANAA